MGIGLIRDIAISSSSKLASGGVLLLCEFVSRASIAESFRQHVVLSAGHLTAAYNAALQRHCTWGKGRRTTVSWPAPFFPFENNPMTPYRKTIPFGTLSVPAGHPMNSITSAPDKCATRSSRVYSGCIGRLPKRNHQLMTSHADGANKECSRRERSSQSSSSEACPCVPSTLVFCHECACHAFGFYPKALISYIYQMLVLAPRESDAIG